MIKIDHKPHARAIPFIAVLLSISMPVHADMHIVKRVRRFTDRPSETIAYTVDIWIAHDREYRASNHTVHIKRYDLNRHWYIDNRTKTFVEWYLDEPPDRQGEGEVLHNEGFAYEPEYDWLMRSDGKEKVISGMSCRQFILDGDADFSEKIIELWVADSLPCSDHYREVVAEHLADSETREIMALFPQLADAIVVTERTTTKLPIAARFSIDSKIIYVEEAQPPRGIYELPGDVRRALRRDN